MAQPLSSPRLRLSEKLREILGSTQVFFQGPGDQSMDYPAIVYERNYAEVQHANNSPYRHTKRYQVTLISRKADDPALAKLDYLPMCTFVRHFNEDGLHHDVYDLYYS